MTRGGPGPRSGAEPFLWLASRAGAVGVVVLVPALLVLFGVVFPLGWVEAPDHGHLRALAGHPLTRLGLFGFFVLSLIHCAHRLRLALVGGFRLRRSRGAVAVACYGLAAAGSLAVAWITAFVL